MNCRAVLLLTFTVLPVAALELTAGYTEAPPMSFTRSDGEPDGVYVQVLNEAARREGITLRWRPSMGVPGQLLREHGIDLWPNAIPSEFDQSQFHVSREWWTSEIYFLTRQSSSYEAWEDLTGKPVTQFGTTAIREHIRKHLSGLMQLSDAPDAQAIADVCTGRAEALLIEDMAFRRLLLDRPPECRDVQLGMLPWPAGVFQVSIMSRPEHADAIDRLRTRIDDLAEDGTLSGIAARWSPSEVSTAARLAAVVKARGQRTALTVIAGSALVLLAVSGVFILRLRAQITRRERAEEMLATYARHLEQSNEHWRQFAYAAAHDLQEPMRNMSLYSQLLERRFRLQLDGEAVKFLDTIVEAAGRMQNLMNGLFAYMRSGDHPAQPTAAVDMNTVVKRVLAEHSAERERSAATFSIAPLPSVLVHEEHALELMRHLISNALKFSAVAATRIEIASEGDGRFRQFSVRDNGIGIPPEYHQRIFGVFRRLHGRDVPGVGIGLAICQRIVARYGGRISVESDGDGKGSTFRFTLPVAGYHNG